MKKLLFALLALYGATVIGQPKSDWERENEDRLKQSDERVVPPPAFDKARLVALKLAADTEFHYFIDPATVSVGADRIVRYVVVGRSPAGAENILFEGLRCPGEYRIYAVGQADGSWGGEATEWRAVPRDARLAENALARRYFCPLKQAILNAQEGVDALRGGGHPALVRGLSQEY